MSKSLPSAGSPRRRGRPNADCALGAEMLLRTARRTFALRGFEATSVREIARQAGVDAALIAHHFGSKEALWLAVVEQLVVQFDDFLRAGAALRADASLGPRQRVEKILLMFIDRVFQDPDIGMFFSTAATEAGERLNVLIERLVRPFNAAVLPLFEDAMAAGELRQSNPVLLCSMMTHGISKTVAYSHLLREASPLPDDPDQFKRELSMTVLQWLG